MTEWLLTIFSTVDCRFFFLNMQDLLFEIRDAEIILYASVMLLSAMVYCICLVLSIELIIISVYILGKT